jgi:hypothetical protein
MMIWILQLKGLLATGCLACAGFATIGYGRE